jgi:superoxide dismutase, Fe-Mn family
MAYTAKDYSKLLGMKGFSDTLLSNHFTLYQGYVANINKILDTLASMARDGRTGTPEHSELKRRLGFEFDGMRLHELYFDNLGDGAPPKGGAFYEKLTGQFGSLDAWQKEFKATGMMRGIGWAILYLDTTSGVFINQWINEHETGHLAGCAPILIMDVFEHAYMIDYGLKRAEYIEAFFANLDWKTIESRVILQK